MHPFIKRYERMLGHYTILNYSLSGNLIVEFKPSPAEKGDQPQGWWMRRILLRKCFNALLIRRLTAPPSPLGKA